MPFKPTRFNQAFACLDCGGIVDAASDATSGEPARAPQAGDIAICFHCQHVMAYGDKPGEVRPLTDQEIIDIAGDKSIVEAQNALGAFHKAGKKLEAMLEMAGKHAHNMLLGHKVDQLVPVFLMIDGDDDVMLAPVPWNDDNDKKRGLKIARATMKLAGIVRYSIVSEAWTANQPIGWKKGMPVGPLPADRPDRKEVVWALAADKQQHRVRVWNIVRGEAGTVVRLDHDRQVEHLPGMGGRMAELLK
jgi:hypothetical protein